KHGSSSRGLSVSLSTMQKRFLHPIRPRRSRIPVSTIPSRGGWTQKSKAGLGWFVPWVPQQCIRLLGCAVAPEERVHVGPELLPVPALFVRQLVEAVLGADAGEAGISLPSPRPLHDLHVTVVEPLATPREVLAEPFEGLPAPAHAFGFVQLARVLAVSATRQRRGACGVIARAFRHGLSKSRFRGECAMIESRRRGVEILEQAQLSNFKLFSASDHLLFT